MMKLFTKRLKLCAAACALFALGCPQQASADDIVSGEYYHILYAYINKNVDNVQVAFHYRTHRLQWDTYDATAPEQIFRLEKASGENEYYLQSLATGEYLSGTTGQYEMEMQGSATNRITTTITSENKTSTIKINGNKNSTFEPYGQNHGNDNGNKKSYTRGDYVDNNRWGKYKNWWFASRTNNWVITKVTDTELNAAKLKLRLIDAYKAYNQTAAYNLSETGLISIPSNASDLYGTGTPIFVSLAQSSEGNDFTQLVDGNTSTYFQATYNGGTYKGSTAGVAAPQFFQVDLGDGVASKGVQMKMGLRDGGWGASSQPAEITLYATNDADAAASDFTIAACNADSKWVKIGTSKLTEEYAVSLTNGVANWKKNIAANTYITENFGLKNSDTGYRYLRFYVNKVFFPNSPLFDFTFGEFQLYNLDNIETPEPKKLDVQTLLTAMDKAETDLKARTTDNYATDLESLNTAINNLSKRDYVTISNLGYASFYSEENLILPEGLTAYAVTATNDNVATLTQVAGTGDILPAKTPVILKGNAGTYELTVTTETGTAVTDNLLNGTYTPLEQTEGTTYYVLSKNSEGKAALMKYNAGNILHSGKAYLIPISTASSKFLNFSFDSTTGIQSAVNEDSKDTKTYDLEGRSVKNPQKGIYIQNGKKIILK